ncbi:hypothetical protein [Nostoc sp. CMAA1605]|uniref:hypothetical protein n=1 Tax=Nostoc sp. CMAA1605 TaxID=2055159 RepID=UPI001F31E1A8|nr:hypothetical protein [Nostoc sp. CMAA1605]MCF4970791.1 hypothetical protein [Nostoc sp. CMAA1605]
MGHWALGIGHWAEGQGRIYFSTQHRLNAALPLTALITHYSLLITHYSLLSTHYSALSTPHSPLP